MKIIAYYTLADQELNGQKPAVQEYAASHNAKIAAQYVEKWNRKQPWTKLSQAVKRAKATDSLLVIAKLGRLEFNVAVTELLTRSGVQFVCLDKPSITPSSIKEAMASAWDKSQETSRRKRRQLVVDEESGQVIARHRHKRDDDEEEWSEEDY